MPANKTAVFSSCAANYIPKSLVLANSLKKHHPQWDMHLLLVDNMPDKVESDLSAFSCITKADDLAIPNFSRWMFGHTLVEACTAVKPFMLNHLLGLGYENVIYLDPDTAVFSTLQPLVDMLGHASVLLTPHINRPEETEKAILQNEINSLRHGLYNLGFIAVRNDETGRGAARWWQDRCYLACYDDIPQGVFTDQKWIDLLPVFFEGVEVVRNSACNVATWNYNQRRIERTASGEFTVDGNPLMFHHFTGYDSGTHHEMLRPFRQDMPAALTLSEWYEAQCRQHENERMSAIKWKYASYETGEPIAPAHRRLYRSSPDLMERFPDPFSVLYNRWLKSEGLWAEEFVAAKRSFVAFLKATENEMQFFIRETPKLGRFPKRVLGAAVCVFFGTLRAVRKAALSLRN